MQNNTIHTFKSFRFRSIFITIFNSIIVACILLCAIFTVIFTDTIITTNKENSLVNNQAYLDTLANNTDYLMQNLHQSQTQMSYSGNILGQIFSKSVNQDYISDINMELIHLVDHTTLIKEAFLYIPYFGAVISSDKTGASQTNYDDYKYSYLIANHHEESVPLTTVYHNGKRSTLFFDGETPILVRDFPLIGEKRLASLYYIIQLSTLQEFLFTDLPDFTQLYIFDKDGNPLIGLSSGSDTFSDSLLNSIFSEEKTYYTTDDSTLFHKQVDFSGWHYIYAVDNSLFQLSAVQIASLLLPSLLAILILSLIISFAITQKIYRPIRQLTETIDNPEKAEKKNEAPRNELEYFSHAYQDAANKKKELNKMLSSISHDTTSRIFHNLMADTMEDKEKVPELLQIINSPYQEDSLYRICLIEFAAENAETEKIQILNVLSGLCSELDSHFPSHSHPLMMHGLVFCVVTAFPKDTLILSVQKAKQTFEELVQNYGLAQNISTTIAFGHLYHSIFDLPYSYQDAIKTLKAKQEARLVTPVNPLADSEVSAEEMPLKADYNTYAQHILNTIIGNDVQEASNLAHRALQQMAASHTDNLSLADSYINFISILLDKILNLEYIDHLPISTEDFTRLIRSKQEEIDAHALYVTAAGTCDTLLNATEKILKKQKNHYIISAQEYISSHYQDFDLSLNSVSAAIDINSSYLSRLFKNNLGIRFTDFLNGFRINRSIEFLENTQKSVKTISEECGFNSVQNYIRVFKKITGMTPKQYRDTYSGKKNNAP